MKEQTYLFEGKKEVAVGRDPEQCEILYPPDFKTVGRKHLAIVEDAGRYEIRVNKQNPVFINGERAQDDMELPDRALIALGTKEGPAFLVERIANDALPETQDYGEEEEIHTTVSKSRTWLKVALMLIVVTAGYFGFNAWQTQQQIKQIDEQAGAAIEALYESIDSDIGKLAASLQESVYLVLLKSDAGETAMGTAWVAKSGVLATNSHVAQLFYDIQKEPGISFVVRSTVKPYKEFKINKVAMHPGYDAFAKMWSKKNPQTVEASGKVTQIKFIPAYDVALLFPETTDGLAKPFKLASEQTLRELSSGEQVAYIGFPMEGMVQQANIEPTPQIQVANITSITDFFRGQPYYGSAQMIQHSLPATGGASGSPIINKKGEVIALLNAGNVINVNSNGERVPNAVAINFAQRVDLLDPLLESGDNFSIANLEEQWEEGFKRFSDQEQVNKAVSTQVKNNIVKGWMKYHGVKGQPELIEESSFSISNANKINNFPAYLKSFTTKKKGRYLVLAIAENNKNVDMFVAKVSGSSLNEVGRNTKKDFYPYVDNVLPANAKYNVYLVTSGLKTSEVVKGSYWVYRI